MPSRSNRLYIDADTKFFYSNIKKQYSHLKLSNSDLFSLALTIAYYHNIKKPLRKKIAFIRNETIPEDLFSVMILIAIKEFGKNNYEWADNPLIVLDLVEEYANAGIRILNELMEDYNQDLKENLLDIIFELNEPII